MVFAVTSAVACGHCLLRPPFVGKLGPEEVASVPVRGLQGAGGGGEGGGRPRCHCRQILCKLEFQSQLCHQHVS